MRSRQLASDDGSVNTSSAYALDKTGGTHPIVPPTDHITGIIAKPCAIFDGSVISIRIRMSNQNDLSYRQASYLQSCS